MKTSVHFLAVVLSLSVTTPLQATSSVEWTRQLGTTGSDQSNGVSADSMGNVYITGSTAGSLEGTNAGDGDAFLSKYDAAGALLWIEQLGTSAADEAQGVSADSLGNVYIAGHTSGSLGGPHIGLDDAFVAKYNSSGSLLWSRQLGTPQNGTRGVDQALGVSADSLGNVYISGFTNSDLGGPNPSGFLGFPDAFVSKYNASGTLQWTKQLGTTFREVSTSVSADSLGNVYIAGNTDGPLEGETNAGPSDAFVAKYDAAGALLWTRLIGTESSEAGTGVAADPLGNVYVTGSTEGDLVDGTNAGVADAFLSKFDPSGALLWTKQLGTSLADTSLGVSVDSEGNAYISGFTAGDLKGTNAGPADAFVAKYDPSGTLLWTEQLGTSDAEWSLGVSADAQGKVYISGWTAGDLDGANAGGRDAFLAKLNPAIPEPSALLLVLLGGVFAAAMSRRRA